MENKKMPKAKLVTIKVYEHDRNWLEKLKRKFGHKNFQDAFRAIKKVFTNCKLETELE